MDARVELLRRAAGLRVHSASGRRAPHKPLLMLLAVARSQTSAGEQAPWGWWADRLGPLIVEYAPHSVRPRPEYPFRRLVEDGLWQIEGMADFPEDAYVEGGGAVHDLRLGWLKDADTAAGLPVEFVRCLRGSPATADLLVRLLLHRHFPPTIWEEVLRDTGVAHDLTAVVAFPEGALTSLPLRGRTRSAQFARDVLDLDGGRCGVCAYDGREVVGSSSSPVGLEAAHVRWWNADGDDTPDNGLTLCALHHRLFDRGMLGFDPDTRLAQTSPRLRASASWATVRAGVTAPERVTSANLAWQLANVFKVA